MDRRMYFVLPDVNVAEQVERDLLLGHIDSSRMHFIAKRGTDLRQLPEATNSQKSDIRHGMYVGMIGGAISGGCIGLLLYLKPELLGIPVSPGVMFLLGGFGAIFGLLTSGFLIGSSTPNVHLKEFERDFEQGRIVLILDVPKERVEEIAALIKGHFPAAQDHGIDPTMPAFP